MERFAVVRHVEPGEEPPAPPDGVVEWTRLRAGKRAIDHYAASSRDALDGEVHEEIFAWQVEPPAGATIERAGLLLTIKAGQEQAYRDWLESDVIEKLITLWNRNGVHRHDVLVAGTSVVAFYECAQRYNVLKAFREPEALVILMTQLAPILELDPTMPMSLFEEASHWSARDRQPA